MENTITLKRMLKAKPAAVAKAKPVVATPVVAQAKPVAAMIAKQKSYSQIGQDLAVLEFYENKKNGYFVEIGASNGIELSNTYTKLYNELYGDNNTPQYSSFYNNNVNIDKIIKNYDNENRVAEGFYKQLYDNTHENNIIKKSKPFNNENFINYKLGEIDSYDLADFDAFSKLKFQKNQKINIRSKTLYPNDDIKLMNNIDLNHNIPWWQSASLIDGFN